MNKSRLLHRLSWWLTAPRPSCDFHALRKYHHGWNKWTRCINASTHREVQDDLRGYACDGDHTYLYPVLAGSWLMPRCDGGAHAAC